MKKYLKFIGILLFIYICKNIEWKNAISILKKFNLRIYFSALFFTFLIVGIKAYRFKCIVNEKNFKFSDANTLFFIGIFWGIITPGKIGELFKVTYLNKYGLNKMNSFIAVIVDRMYDVFSLAVISFWALFYFSEDLNAKYSIITIIIFFFIFYFIIFSKLGKVIIEKILRKFSKNIEDKDIKKFFQILRQNFFNSIIISFICWILFYLQLYIIAVSLNLKISYIQICAIMSILSVVMLIPITVFGIGTRDISLIAMFSIIGLTREKAVTFSLMHLILYVLNGFIGLFFYIFRKDHKELK